MIWIIFAVLALAGLSAGINLGFLKGAILAGLIGAALTVLPFGLLVVEFPIGMAIGSALAGIAKLLRRA